MTVICSKQGYKTATLIVKSVGRHAFNQGTRAGANLLVTDPLSITSYPPETVVMMEPLIWKSEDEKAQWEYQKQIEDAKKDADKGKCFFSDNHNC